MGRETRKKTGVRKNRTIIVKLEGATFEHKGLAKRPNEQIFQNVQGRIYICEQTQTTKNESSVYALAQSLSAARCRATAD